MEARRKLWIVWGLSSLAWLVVGAVLFGSGLAVPDHAAYSSRPAPLLSRNDCNRIADDEGARVCAGVAQLARQRRVQLQEAEARNSVMAGSLIVGPPLFGALIVLGIGYALDRGAKPAGRRRPTALRH